MLRNKKGRELPLWLFQHQKGTAKHPEATEIKQEEHTREGASACLYFSAS